MRGIHNTAVLALAALTLGGCASRAALGRVPVSVVDLYDTAKSDGLMEIEIARDGRIMEAEADIPVSALPPAALAKAREMYPNAEITGAEKEVQIGGALWEVKLRDGDRDMELLVDAGGQVRETEMELRRDEVPAIVLTNAEARVPGGAFRSVERISAGDLTSYHVKIERDGTTYKIVLDESGGVHRAVREQRAEIEIPLR